MVENAGEIQIQGNKKREKNPFVVLSFDAIRCQKGLHAADFLSMLLISLPASGSPGNRSERDVAVSREGRQGVQVKCQHRLVFQPVSVVPLLLPRPGAFPVAHMSPQI